LQGKSKEARIDLKLRRYGGGTRFLRIPSVVGTPHNLHSIGASHNAPIANSTPRDTHPERRRAPARFSARDTEVEGSFVLVLLLLLLLLSLDVSRNPPIQPKLQPTLIFPNDYVRAPSTAGVE
jgi:hypothetical protein